MVGLGREVSKRGSLPIGKQKKRGSLSSLLWGDVLVRYNVIASECRFWDGTHYAIPLCGVGKFLAKEEEFESTCRHRVVKWESRGA